MTFQFEREQYVRSGRVRLYVGSSGPTTGEPVVLLHGFPDFSYGWRHQVEPLAREGYHVIVPDQRGYNLSDKPTEVGAYDIDRLVGDVLSILDHFGAARAHVVGHDWGGGVAWWLAANHPERLSRAVILNCPHFSVYRRAQATFEQLWRSWYAYLFQFGVAEWMCARKDYEALVELGLKTGSRDDSDLDRYRASWRREGALRGMLAWYRALPKALLHDFEKTRISVPLRLIWGARDAFLSRTMAAPSVGFCEEGDLVLRESGTHWLHWEDPAGVNALISEWLQRRGAGEQGEVAAGDGRTDGSN